MANYNEITSNPSNRAATEVVKRGGRVVTDKSMVVVTTAGDRLTLKPVEITLRANKIVSRRLQPGGQVTTNYLPQIPDQVSLIEGSD